MGLALGYLCLFSIFTQVDSNRLVVEGEDSNHLVEVEEKHSNLEVEAHCHSSFDSEVRRTYYQGDIRKDKKKKRK